jgi:hypothetical protein
MFYKDRKTNLQYYWDFDKNWRMPDKNSSTRSFPLLKNIKYKKLIHISAQIGIPTTGKPEISYYSITTQNIVDGLYNVILNNAPNGVSASSLYLSNNIGTLTINTSGITPAGSYLLSLIIDNTTSEEFNFTVNGTNNIYLIENKEVKMNINGNMLTIYGLNKNATLTIIDSLGNKHIRCNVNENNNTVNLSRLPFGIYIALIEYNHEIKTIKFLK